MGKLILSLDNADIQFIAEQKVFFIATAPDEGKINLSPKGIESFKVINNNRVVWLNLTGSGNETAAHLLENGKITIMFCAFQGKPNILRLYGKGKSIYPNESTWHELIKLFPDLPGARQLIDVTIDLVQNSCGMGVPIMNFQNERTELIQWAKLMGDEKLKEYSEERNSVSIDGKPTGM